MQLEDFNFDHKNPKQLLHAQAVVTMMIIMSYCESEYATARMHRISRRAQERAYRRWEFAFGGK